MNNIYDEPEQQELVKHNESFFGCEKFLLLLHEIIKKHTFKGNIFIEKLLRDPFFQNFGLKSHLILQHNSVE